MKSVSKRFLFAIVFFVGACVARADDYQGATHLMPYDEDTINYSKTPDRTPVSRLQKKIDAGEVKLDFEDEHGYLLSVLKALSVPVSSQMLVFSKTSFQRERIDPKHPRGLFVGDDVYVGFIPGSHLLEVSAADPKLGGVFYTLEQTKVERPKFKRTDQCLECHASAKTMGVPGHLVRSFVTDEVGVVDLSTGASQVNHRTPFEDRWGGWYVTGTHGSLTHRGNLIGKAAFDKATQEPNYRGNVTDLSSLVDVSPYPAPQSDIVALMVLEHQVHMHNYITRLNYEATIALQQYGHVNYMKSAIDGFLRYLLFTEEAPLSSQVKGNPAFVADFEARGPRDSKGRSLRDFDLKARMFKYPCSYLIYSESFDALPAKLKDQLYKRLYDILTGQDKSSSFAEIAKDDRNAIREILADTKTDLPDYWKNDATPASHLN
jgi:hypothetical protein